MGSELAPPNSVSGSMMDLWKVVAGALPQMKDGLSAPPVSRVTYIGKRGYGVESGSKVGREEGKSGGRWREGREERGEVRGGGGSE